MPDDDGTIVIPFAPPDPDVVWEHYPETRPRAGAEPVSRERAQELMQEWPAPIAAFLAVPPTTHRRNMSTTCPRCGSLKVHRSSARAAEERRYHPLQSPYRCEECDKCFWVFNLTAWRMGFGVFVVLITLAIIALLIPAKAPQRPPSARPAGVAIALPNALG